MALNAALYGLVSIETSKISCFVQVLFETNFRGQKQLQINLRLT